MKYIFYFLAVYLFCLCKYAFFSLYILIKYRDLYWDDNAWIESLYFAIPLFIGLCIRKFISYKFSI